VNAGDHTVFVDQEGCGEGVNSAIELSGGIVTGKDSVVHLLFGDIRLDDLPAFFIHSDTEDGETFVFELLFEFYEPGNLYLAGPTPGGPEVEEDGFAFVFGQ
jgi:hypothetical protein